MAKRGRQPIYLQRILDLAPGEEIYFATSNRNSISVIVSRARRMFSPMRMFHVNFRGEGIVVRREND